MKTEVRVHDLKTDDTPFCAVWDGRKTHEVRKNDRAFSAGDFLALREQSRQRTYDKFDRHDSWEVQPTGRSIMCMVTYVSPGGAYGLPADLCVMSIRVLSRSTGQFGGTEFMV